MNQSIVRMFRFALGLAGAVGFAAALNSTTVAAAGCCTQCSCINLCINDDGCGNNSSVLCVPGVGTSRTCSGGPEVNDFCYQHCSEM